MDETFFRSLANMALKHSPYPDPRFPPSPYYRFLKLLASTIYPRLSVELGVCGGGGSLHLVQGWAGGRVIGVDFTNDYPENILFIQQNYSNFMFYPGDSIKSAAVIGPSYGPVDLLFIDTTHTYEQTTAEYEAWRPHLGDKAVVCFDDLFRVEMGSFWEELPEPKVRLDDLHHSESGGGFGVIWKG